MLLITNYLPNTHVNYPSPNFIPLYSMINMHTKLWHTAIHSVTFFLRGLRIVREQLLFILGLYQGHNHRIPNCLRHLHVKEIELQAFSSCALTSKHELKTPV